MMPILNKKLEEFPDKDKYLKKEYDMQYLTTIDNKVKKGYELSQEELKFLYEIYGKIEGFGYEKDPRIEEIKSKRNEKQDLAKIFNCEEDKVYIGDIEEYNIYELKDKKVVMGNLSLFNLTNVGTIILPQYISGNLDLRSLTSTEGLVLPQSVHGYLNLSGLTSAKGLVLPQNVVSLNLSGLTSAEGLVLPQSVGSLILRSLTNAESLTLPQRVNGYIDLSGLTSSKGLKLPKGFPLEKLKVSKAVMVEIMANPELYYQTEELETVKENEGGHTR